MKTHSNLLAAAVLALAIPAANAALVMDLWTSVPA